MKKTGYTKICRFHYNGNYYQMFKAQRQKIAFLKIDEHGAYIFPTEKEFVELVTFFEQHQTGHIACFQNGNHRKVGFIPSVLKNINGKAKVVALTSAMVASMLTGCGPDYYVPEESSYVYEGDDIEIDLDVDDSYTTETESISNIVDEDLFAEHDTTGYVTTADYELLNSGSPKSLRLYNNRYFDDFFGDKKYSLNEILDVLESNKSISDEYKPYIKDFIQKMYAYYPDLEWRVFVYNLSTVKLETADGQDMDFLTTGALAFYNSDDNILKINTDYDIEKNELGLVTFRHELGHMFNNLKLTTSEYKIKYYFKVAGEGQYLQEGMNVIFTSEPFLDEYSDLTKENMGYSITTNVTRVLIDCLDYEVQDSISNNVYDFERRMGEYMPDDIDPTTIETLVEVQWMDCATGKMEVDDEDYQDLYGYLSRMYIKKHCTQDMTYDEVMEVKEELTKILLTGIHYHPEYVYTDIIEEEFNNFMELNNISGLSR